MNMHVCILSAVNFKHMSLISLYTSLLKEKGYDYDIIYMDKYIEDEPVEAPGVFVYKNRIPKKLPRWLKTIKYLRFIRYAKGIIKEKGYDFIIVWNDIAIVMFTSFLYKYYKGRYCLNIRDYCGQEHPLVYRRFKKAIENACFVTISSEGFKSFLPPFNYYHMRSLNEPLLETMPRKTKKNVTKEHLHITFVGTVRFIKENIELINAFSQDGRFILEYCGTNSHLLADYIQRNKVNNVVLSGTFNVKETGTHLQRADILNNMFGNKSTSVTTLESIRLYHGAYSRIPIMVNSDTHMAQVVRKYGLGFIVDEVNCCLPSKLYNWFASFDYEKFISACDNFIAMSRGSNAKLFKIIEEHLSV